MKERKKIEKDIGKLQEQLRVYEAEEQPAFQRWMHQISGPARSELSEAQSDYQKISGVRATLAEHRRVVNLKPQKQMTTIIAYAINDKGQSVEGLRKMELEEWVSLILDFMQTEFDRLAKNYAENSRGEDEDDADWDDDEEEDDGDSYSHLTDLMEELDDDESYNDFLGIMFTFDERDYEGVSPEDFMRDFIEKRRKIKARRAREIFHELSRKLHPDAGGEMTPRRRILWDKLQEAYQIKDLAVLEALFAEVELADSDQNAHQIAPSRLMKLVEHLKNSLKSVRELVRRCKGEPGWGFSGWSAAKRSRMEEQIIGDINYQRSIYIKDWNEESRLLRSAISRAINKYKKDQTRAVIDAQRQQYEEEKRKIREQTNNLNQEWLERQKKRDQERQESCSEPGPEYKQAELLF